MIIEKNFWSVFIWNASEEKSILTLDWHTCITTEMKWSMYDSSSSNRHILLSKQLQYKIFHENTSLSNPDPV